MRKPAFLGILQLDTQFQRVIGDAGNLLSYAFPAKIKVVKKAGVSDIVKTDSPTPVLTQAFCDAARELELNGAVGIISTCGFLVHIQAEIAQAVSIPVMVSALSLYPHVCEQVNSQKVGILTASKTSLSPQTLQKAGIDSDQVCISGMENCAAFNHNILQDKGHLLSQADQINIQQAAIEKAQTLLRQDPDIRAFLLECGNLPPYAKAIQAATQRPVFSILDAANYIYHRAQNPLQTQAQALAQIQAQTQTQTQTDG